MIDYIILIPSDNYFLYGIYKIKHNLIKFVAINNLSNIEIVFLYLMPIGAGLPSGFRSIS